MATWASGVLVSKTKLDLNSHTITPNIISGRVLISTHYILVKQGKHPYIHFDTSQPRPYEIQKGYLGVSMDLKMYQDN